MAALARISFMDALRWVRDPKADTILNSLLIISNRPNRSELRVIKRCGKPFKLLNKPRNVLRKVFVEIHLRLSYCHWANTPFGGKNRNIVKDIFVYVWILKISLRRKKIFTVAICLLSGA